MYMALKHPHLMLALLFFAVYLWRGILLIANRPEQHKALRVAPHILATLLLATGIGMVHQFGVVPGWVYAKAVLLFVLVACNTLAFQRLRGRAAARPVFVLGLVAFLAMGWLAGAKPLIAGI